MRNNMNIFQTWFIFGENLLSDLVIKDLFGDPYVSCLVEVAYF